MVNSKKWYQSYTIWAGILECVIGVLGLVDIYFKTGDYSPSGITFLLTGIVTIALRYITKLPIS